MTPHGERVTLLVQQYPEAKQRATRKPTTDEDIKRRLGQIG
jgi:hypothetical protein